MLKAIKDVTDMFTAGFFLGLGATAGFYTFVTLVGRLL